MPRICDIISLLFFGSTVSIIFFPLSHRTGVEGH
nr:MAG TPA: hypothetical protein [Caudoviricetes sp.]